MITLYLVYEYHYLEEWLKHASRTCQVDMNSMQTLSSERGRVTCGHSNGLYFSHYWIEYTAILATSRVSCKKLSSSKPAGYLVVEHSVFYNLSCTVITSFYLSAAMLPYVLSSSSSSSSPTPALLHQCKFIIMNTIKFSKLKLMHGSFSL